MFIEEKGNKMIPSLYINQVQIKLWRMNYSLFFQ